jgi:FixJ family two-component response regulator
MDSAVFFIDDDPSLRRALVRLLSSYGFCARSFASAREFLSEKLPDSPACLILDLKMPDASGLDVQSTLSQCDQSVPVIFVSGQADISTSVRAMKAGAVDFLTKPVDGDELVAAVRRALDRSTRIRDERQNQKRDREAFDKLSPREKDVCVRIAQGLLNKQVGFELGTSEKTVKAQRAHVMQKLGAHSIADVVRLVERLRISSGNPLSRAAAVGSR